jgi:hypothetical protein
VPEHRLVLTPAEPVSPGSGIDSPAGRQVHPGGQLSQDDRVVALGGPDNAVPFGDQGGDELVQAGP